MNDSGEPSLNVAMPARTSDSSEGLAASAPGSRKRTPRPTALSSEHEASPDDPQHELDALA